MVLKRTNIEKIALTEEGEYDKVTAETIQDAGGSQEAENRAQPAIKV